MELYKLLGLTEGADIADVKKQYKLLAGVLHPDKNPELAGGLFTSITEAYNILKNPESKSAYDATGSVSPNDSKLLGQFQVFINEVIDNSLHTVDPVEHIDKILAGALRDLSKQEAKAAREINRLSKFKGKIKVDEGVNILEAAILNRLENAEHLLKRLRAEVVYHTRFKEMLTSYTFTGTKTIDTNSMMHQLLSAGDLT